MRIFSIFSGAWPVSPPQQREIVPVLSSANLGRVPVGPWLPHRVAATAAAHRHQTELAPPAAARCSTTPGAGRGGCGDGETGGLPLRYLNGVQFIKRAAAKERREHKAKDFSQQCLPMFEAAFDFGRQVFMPRWSLPAFLSILAFSSRISDMWSLAIVKNASA